MIDKEWPEAKPIRLMFQDEARFGRIADTRRCCCTRPVRPMTQAMVTQAYTYAYAAVWVHDGQLDRLILPHVNSACMQVFLDEVARNRDDPRWRWLAQIIIAEDFRNHALGLFAAVFAGAQACRTLMGRTERKSFWQCGLNSLDALENHLEASLKAMEDRARVHFIVAWP